jgi:hypothetical protein
MPIMDGNKTAGVVFESKFGRGSGEDLLVAERQVLRTAGVRLDETVRKITLILLNSERMPRRKYRPDIRGRKRPRVSLPKWEGCEF